YDLQSFLAEQGYLSVYPTGYFGAMTQSALAAYQSAHGVPATGYFGPLSKASITAWIATRSSTVAMNVGTSINPVSTNGTSVSTSMLAPLFPTGYWYQGNWYGVIPTSTKDIAGYWNNGVWYPINNVPGMSTSVATANSGTGYWYNGIFYPTSSSNVGGNASIDQAQGISSSTQADSSAANASSSFGVSKSNWNPYPGTVTGTSVSMSCGYETSSSGTTFICR
ncbi:MAG TPA: peptidoglycan-binding domain-containing protein, partial [Thermodesulfobacteriota bacterium]|nr:peptidoglycan-binding domain-containing protein [Thermodesulfobacteriota bacterium]